MVAEDCGCGTTLPAAASGMRGLGRSAKNSNLFAALNDRAVILLQQIFIDGQDSLSNFRFAAFLSSKWTPVSYKFIMNKTVTGKSGGTYTFDVCVYSRNTEELVTVGMQNNSTEQKASDNESLRKFLAAVDDLYAAHPRLQSAYHASSYGYDNNCDSSRLKRDMAAGGSRGKVEISLLEYRNAVYFENKSLLA